jgi:cystathionine beta-lyase/cystathionine gamma-synthase
MTKTIEHSFSTKLVHAGEKPDPQTGAVAPILVRSKTFAQINIGEKGVYEYSRARNPTRDILETKIAGISGGKYATVFATGLAAEASLFLTLKPGDRILCPSEIYGGTVRLFRNILTPLGIHADYVDWNDHDAVRNAIRPETKYFWIETPTNPSFHIIDLNFVKKLSEKTKIPWIGDLTFAPPCALNAFEYGAYAVVYSLSKYFGGHNDILGGTIVTNDKTFDDKLRLVQKSVGAILSPDECYRVIQEVKTLDIRWKHTSASAQTVAEYLEHSKYVEKVLYPGLKKHKNHLIAKQQIKNGFGSTLSFILKETKLEKIKKFVKAATDTGLIVFGESLASPETLLAYPPTMSHGSLTREERLKLGITDGFFRLSLGFEDPNDIISALETALDTL